MIVPTLRLTLLAATSHSTTKRYDTAFTSFSEELRYDVTSSYPIILHMFLFEGLGLCSAKVRVPKVIFTTCSFKVSPLLQ